MKRMTLVKIHLIATIVATLTILTFFTLSLIAETNGNDDVIKNVKSFILYALPIMVLAMPILKITGDKLNFRSDDPLIVVKKKRMEFMLINGLCLVVIAVFLYYRSHFQTIDNVFLLVQITEFGLGLTNLSLIFLNARDGFRLSERIKRIKAKNQ